MEKLPILFAIAIVLILLFILGLGFAIAKIGLIAIVWALAIVGVLFLLAQIL
ncbi:hypothetical protein [Cytobacillus gottheilii]|uniref:hypothetical protein n=1 Tax=Cytobacillus gottheilii TaxID=859144 RepID=UPI001594D2DC|nr:hypothetical protein [Cytobacillus gottheilii]